MSTKIFNNNFKFHHKNSSSPSLCIYAKNIYNINDDDNKTYITKTPEIEKIINIFYPSQEYKDDNKDNDFKYFFKISPDIDTLNIPHIFNPFEFWTTGLHKKQVEALKYENEIYRILQNKEHTPKYTLTPLLSDSKKFKINNFSKLLGITDPYEYNLFVYIFYIWLKDPNMPDIKFEYNIPYHKMTLEDINIIQYIENNFTFSYIMTPLIPNANTFQDVMESVITSKINLNTIMNNFCDIFSNIIRGISIINKKNITHNDLHSNNIFVVNLPNNHGINTFIYDYDRSYYEGYPNPVLNNNTCVDPCASSQCNIYDYWLDFFKILHYTFRITSQPFKLLLLSIITDKNIENIEINKLFLQFIDLMTHNQFLKYGSEKETGKCSWYWDNNEGIVYIRENIKKLLESYEKVIERLENSKKLFGASFGIVNNNNNNNILLNNRKDCMECFENAMRENEKRKDIPTNGISI